MKILTIGFTKTTADSFFNRLRCSKAKRIVDVRLNNVSQLAGFAKKNDLRFFLKEICGMDYIHLPVLAPTQDILDEYKKNKGDWVVYEREFLDLMKKREIEKHVDPAIIDDGCFLCSENKPHYCHRRLVAEYLMTHWDNVEIKHL
ncbi:MAG: DUF488 domain-containing protein [Zoogloeaceae bacterium]|jgi:uncharacterized protein (DUF488 family)|nr:DUF488 domain-containing protein [Zoogloeaceae bacterium]